MSEAFINQANEILKKFPRLNIGGFYDRDGETIWTFKRIEVMKEYIQKNWIPVPSKSKHKYSSYRLKHVLEELKWTEDQDKYVSNGELILAMMCAGYTPCFKGASPKSLNCNFKVNPTPKQAQLQQVLQAQQLPPS